MHMITDNHMHLDRRGLYLEAVKQFERAGGGRIILVQKPSFPQNLEWFISSFEETIKMCEEARRYVECYPIIGLHPAEFDRLFNKGEKELCYNVLDVVETYVEEKKVAGMGEFGRPHYPVSPETVAESQKYMVEALKRARRLDCPIQLHTESVDNPGMAELDALVKKVGHQKVVKHFSSPSFTYSHVIPSVLATESNIEKAVLSQEKFLMETDYIDDPKRPGAVLGPKTVPRTTKKLLEKGVLTEEMVVRIHQDEIVSLYNIES
ncbi:MAG: TatD family hydrolase [Theionarchaea archaeon]|nr:TatD family hydrolase [Theionarchaea archaeon]